MCVGVYGGVRGGGRGTRGSWRSECVCGCVDVGVGMHVYISSARALHVCVCVCACKAASRLCYFRLRLVKGLAWPGYQAPSLPA